MALSPKDIKYIMATMLQKKAIFPEGTSLDLDVINLTILLQAAGFELEHFDFLTNNDDLPINNASNQLKIQITCGHSNIMAKLNYNITECSCPKKESSHNSSFWEVQGTEPNTPTKPNKSLVINASSNLLPNFSKENAIITKIMIAGIFEFFKSDFSAKKNNEEDIISRETKIQTVRRLSRDRIESLEFSPIYENEKMSETSKNNEIYSTPLSSINLTPVQINKPLEIPNIIVSSPDTHSNQQKVVEGCLINTDPDPTLNKTLYYANAIEESSSSSLNNSSSASDERDTNIIQNIMEARQFLDNALICMKLNLTQNITQQSLPKTPNNTNKPSGLNFNTVNRRMSLDSISHPIASAVKDINNVTSVIPKFVPGKKFESKNPIRKVMGPPVHVGVRKLTMPINKNGTPRPINTSIKINNSTEQTKTIGRTISGTNIKIPNTVNNSNLIKNITKVPTNLKHKK